MSKAWRWIGNWWQIRKSRRGGNVIIVDPRDLSRVRIRVRGQGNVIRVGRLGGGGMVDIAMTSRESCVEIGGNCKVVDALKIEIGQGVLGVAESVRFSLGADAHIVSLRVVLADSNSAIAVGKDLLCSEQVLIMNTDGHPIYDADGNLTNKARDIVIGDHVWIGMKAAILKNSHIPSSCIVGLGSVCARRFEEEGVAICGNPARTVTKPGRRLVWKAEGAQAYLEDISI